MTVNTFSKAAKVVFFPTSLDSGGKSSSSAKARPGSEFFKDSYILTEMIQSVALMYLNKPVFTLGLILGAHKTLNDFYKSYVVTKKGEALYNQQHTGDAIASSVSDPFYEKKLLLAFNAAVPLCLAFGFAESRILSPISYAITFVMGSRIGFQLSQKYVQWVFPPSS